MSASPTGPRWKTRAGILADAKRISANIRQIFVDCDYWNTYVRKPDEEPIDCDPDGALRSALAYADGILNGEVYLAPERKDRHA